MGTCESNVDKTLAKLEGQLELWSAELNVLAAKADVAGQTAKMESQRGVNELKAKLMDAQAKLDEAKKAGGDKWDAFKQGIDSSWKELEGAFKSLAG